MKKWLVILTLFVFAAAALWVGRPAYRGYKERKFAAQARKQMAHGELRKALLSARQALAINTNNVTACEVLADLADAGASPHALVWRQRVAEIQPTISNRVILASCALRYEQPPFPVAVKTLNGLEPQAHEFAPYHVVAAQLALKQGRSSEAEKHFTEAIRLEPTNALHRLNLATIQLESKDAAKAAKAREQLLALRSDAEVGAHATRTLMQQALARKQMEEALRFSDEVLAQKRATFDDALTHLTLLREMKRPEANAYNSQLKSRAATNAVETFTLAERLIALGDAQPTLQWLTKLPAEKQSVQPVPLAIANAYATLKQWQQLEEYLNTQNWKEQECARLALLAYAVRNQKDEAVARVHWDKAVRAAADRPELLRTLAAMASGWGWRREAEEILWRAARALPNERWPVEALHNEFAQARNSHGLYDVYSLLLQRDPANAVLRNNYASLSFLLSTNLAEAHKLAAEVFAADTNNFGFISTYAWSLYLKGQTAEALKLMQRLDSAQLSDPSVASYYGAILAANGQREKALEFLAKADAANVLPEEKALVRETRARLQRP